MESMGIFDSTDKTELDRSQPKLHAHRVSDGSRNFLQRESQIPYYAPLPAIRDGGGGSYESYILPPPPPAGFDHQQCDYQNSTPDANELRRSPEPPTGLTATNYYMKYPAADHSVPLQYQQILTENARTFERNPLVQEAWDSLRRSMVELCKPSTPKYFFGQDQREYTGSEVATNTTIFHNTDNILPNDANIYQDQVHIDVKDDLRNAFRTFDEEWRTTTTMSDASLALGALAIGAVVSNALTSASSSSSASVGSAVVLGLGLTLGGIALRGRKRRGLSVLMTKLGTAATVSGILFSLGSHLPAATACVVGPLAFLVIAVAVALA